MFVQLVIFTSGKHINVLDLRFVGYYRVNMVTLQKYLNKYYGYELVDNLC